METDLTGIDSATVTAIGKTVTGIMTVKEIVSDGNKVTVPVAIHMTGIMTGWKIIMAVTGIMI
jgi:hypothetical protein